MRARCLALPEVTERISHGAPWWFIRDKKAFVAFADHHHGDGRLAIWCAAPPGMQAGLLEASADHYFVPPYVGPSGWVGVRLDRAAAWDEIGSVIDEAWAFRAPAKVVAAWRAAGSGPPAARRVVRPGLAVRGRGRKKPL